MHDLVANGQIQLFLWSTKSFAWTVLQPITTLKTFHLPFCETFVSLVLVSCNFLMLVGYTSFIYANHVVTSGADLSLSKQKCS